MSLPPRILVVGMSGAGKTTFARRLSAATGLPHFELDGLYWAPGWEPRRPSQFRADVERVAAQERWIVDGNYSTLREILWPRAQMVIWLNLPFTTVFARVFARTMSRVFRRTELWQGNRESLARTFLSRESILWWVITRWKSRRRDFHGLRASNRFPQLAWVELSRPGEVERFLAGCCTQRR